MMVPAQHRRPNGKGQPWRASRQGTAESRSNPRRVAPGGAAPPGIYGTIITAAILDTAGGRLPTVALVTAVVVTLLVYWIAEEYAEVLGEQAAGGRLPGWTYITDALAATWPMVSASFAPLLALVLARLAGATALEAANVGLAVAFMLLAFHGWRAALAAQLRGWRLLATCAVAAALGLIMILLKDLVLIHLH
jgi:hypothetical protein